MKKRIKAMVFVMLLLLSLAACGTQKAVTVKVPEEMTQDFLEDYAKDKGVCLDEGHLYLVGSYLYAVRENGEIGLIHEKTIDVYDTHARYMEGDCYRNDGILLLTTKGELVVGNSDVGWFFKHK